jgi:hypothetical protein
MKRIFLVAVAGVALMGAGCNPMDNAKQTVEQNVANSVAEGVIKQETGGSVNVTNNGQAVTYQDTKNGASGAYGQDIQIPSDFPADVPRYPGAKTMIVNTAESGKQASLTQTTGNDIAKVKEWYKGQLTSQGFTQESSADMGTGSALVYSKGQVKISIYIASSQDQGQAPMVTMVVGREE